MTAKEYKEKYNKPVKCKILCDRAAGSNNPAYQHGGKLSPFSKKYIHADKIDREELFKKAAKTRTNNKNDVTSIDYWLKQTDGDIEEAQKLLSNRQATFTLEKCIKKHGLEKGTEIWNARQEKWLNSYKKTNFSKISQELFWFVFDQLDDKTDVYFAQLDKNKQKDETGINHEITLKLETISVKPDFINTKTKHIIEFDGTYWHGRKGHGNKEREKIRDEYISKEGYKILHINEHDYKKDKERIIQKCLNFLTQ